MATSLGFPTPPDSTPIAQGAASDRALAAAVDSYLAPTAWATATLATGWTSMSTGVRYRRRAGVVYVDIYAAIKSGTSSVVATLPTGFRPSTRQFFTGTYNDGTRNIFVNTDGTVECPGAGGIAGGFSFSLG
ncbi:MAG: hypothetical protein QM597_06755 [Aeromicrobium sp.]|uniref:hypothetical protein n=1 Tax=Aeromicrobium sp. TaxID=1871063 RepID=UPI0039E2E1AC